jgi:type II secretory pathway pseudopilin PulG
MKYFSQRQCSHSVYQDRLQEKDKSFTLIRLLIVIAIFGVLIAVLVPRITAFFVAGQMVAANKEVANVETAAKAYWFDSNGQWPTNDCNTDLSPDYMNKTAVHYNYKFDADGLVVVPDGKISEVDANIKWNEAKHIWEKD